MRAYAQPAKGHLVRYIIKNKIDHPDELVSFTIDGYKFNKELSTKSNMVFTREKH
ncbi:MAG: peroxide stress protein YaaA [Bacteroidales bacterium]